MNRFFTPVEGHPRIAEVRKEPDQILNIGSNWHTDHSYDQIPAMGSILCGKDVPAVGGDTCFASMHAAYDGLSHGMKGLVDGLWAEHSSRHAFVVRAREQVSGDVVGGWVIRRQQLRTRYIRS
ncbi:MAG: taurine dioxygenase [Candidatus Poriferisodalaceae bacterium]